MALPCIDDSCNITARINPTTRHLTLQAFVNPAGGLFDCMGDGGLGINLIGDPGIQPAVDQGLVHLGITAGGELWAAPERAHTENFGGGIGLFDVAKTFPFGPQLAGGAPESLGANPNTNPITDNVLTNPYPTPALVLVTGQFRLGWSIDKVGTDAFLIGTVNGVNHYIPYHAKVRSQILGYIGDTEPADWTASGAGIGVQKTAFFDIGGMALNDECPQHLRDWRDFSFAQIVPAGKKLFLAVTARHDGDKDIRTFVDTDTLPNVAGPMNFPDRGIKAAGEAVWFPLNATAS